MGLLGLVLLAGEMACTGVASWSNRSSPAAKIVEAFPEAR
jgi:hypothetical protein